MMMNNVTICMNVISLKQLLSTIEVTIIIIMNIEIMYTYCTGTSRKTTLKKGDYDMFSKIVQITFH